MSSLIKLLEGDRYSMRISEPETLATEVVGNGVDDPQQREFIQAAVNRFLNGDRYKHMLVGQRYFENKNDILNRKRTVIGKDGEMVEAPYLANNRLSHSFLRKLTKQKIGYLLSKRFSITSEDETFQDALANYFDDALHRRIKNCGQDSVVQSIGWLQVYYDATGTLKFKRIPATEIIPFWEDIDHTILDSAIRVFDTIVYEGGNEETIRRVKYFTKDTIFNYIMSGDGGSIELDTDMPTESYFTLVDDGSLAASEETSEEGAKPQELDGSWTRIPLIAFKYNSEEESLLTYIKDLIDDYDSRTSDVANMLEDEPNKIKVVKNYDGTDKGEFVYNLAKYRTLFLRDNGDVSAIDTTMNVDAVDSHLTRTRRDIFECGGGVDTQTKDLGNASGVALKFVYSDLDMDCSDFGAEMAWSIGEMIWFIKQDMMLKGLGDFSEAAYEIIFNTDITINETETISNIMASMGLVSNKTLLEQHPYVKDVSAEEAQLEIESQEAMDRIEEQAKKALELERQNTTQPLQTSSAGNPTESSDAGNTAGR